MVISAPGFTRKRTVVRLVKRANPLRTTLAEAVLVSQAMDSELRERDEQLKFYDQIEKLKDAELLEHVDRLVVRR